MSFRPPFPWIPQVTSCPFYARKSVAVISYALSLGGALLPDPRPSKLCLEQMSEAIQGAGLSGCREAALPRWNRVRRHGDTIARIPSGTAAKERSCPPSMRIVSSLSRPEVSRLAGRKPGQVVASPAGKHGRAPAIRQANPHPGLRSRLTTGGEARGVAGRSGGRVPHQRLYPLTGRQPGGDTRTPES